MPAGDDPAYADRPIAAVRVQPEPGDGSAFLRRILPGKFDSAARVGTQYDATPSLRRSRAVTRHGIDAPKACASGPMRRVDSVGPESGIARAAVPRTMAPALGRTEASGNVDVFPMGEGTEWFKT